MALPLHPARLPLIETRAASYRFFAGAPFAVALPFDFPAAFATGLLFAFTAAAFGAGGGATAFGAKTGGGGGAFAGAGATVGDGGAVGP